MAKFKYVINKSRKYSNGEYPIFLRIQYKSIRKLVSTQKSISLKYWDEKNGVILPKAKSDIENKYLSLLDSELQKRINILKKDLIILESQKPVISIDDIANLFDDKKKSAFVLSFFQTTIDRFYSINKKGNAAVYKNVLAKFKEFRKDIDVKFEELNYKMLKDFETYLISEGCKVNTVSIYMRTLRSIYNKAINEGAAKKELYPFDKFKIKSEKTTKRAIVKGSISSLKKLDLSTLPDLDKARDYFLFSFYTRGMSFIDMAFLKVSNITDDRLTYSRNKTNQKFSIRITPQISGIIAKYNSLEDKDSYLFPIIIDPEGDVYTQYRNAMRLTNKKLKKIGEMLELNVPLTTYVSRHSWATIAKREGIPTAIISEGLGHETERTTQIYLDSFENDVLDDANDLITDI